MVNCCRREVPGMKILWTALNRSNIMKKSEIVILSNFAMDKNLVLKLNQLQ